jgi:putative endonuclease
VKARATLESAADSVTERQKQRIAAAAEIWLAANPVPAIRDIHFDAILVAPGRLPRHIQAAFET